MGIHDEAKSLWLANEKSFIEKAIKNGKVVLGICLGAQLIADVLGAPVYINQFKEIGWHPIELTPAGKHGGSDRELCGGTRGRQIHTDAATALGSSAVVHCDQRCYYEFLSRIERADRKLL